MNIDQAFVDKYEIYCEECDNFLLIREVTDYARRVHGLCNEPSCSKYHQIIELKYVQNF